MARKKQPAIFEPADLIAYQTCGRGDWYHPACLDDQGKARAWQQCADARPGFTYTCQGCGRPVTFPARDSVNRQ